MADVAYRLKSHLMYLLTEKLTLEYNDQIEKWKRYIDDVADGVGVAKAKVESTLTAANAEVEAAKEQAFAYSLMAFNLVTGPAVAFLGSAIALKLAPKFLPATIRVSDKIKATWARSPAGRPFMGVRPTTAPNPDMVYALTIGDIAGGVGGWLKGKVVDMVKPTPDVGRQTVNTSFVRGAPDWQSLKTGLNKELFNTQLFARNALTKFKDAVEADTEWGEKALAKLLREQPNLRGNEKLQEPAGQVMINKWLNEKRNDWAMTWFYYGFNPGKLPANFDVITERQIWAEWLMAQHIQLETRADTWHVVSDHDFLMTGSVQGELNRMAMPNGMFNASTYDKELLKALVDVRDIEGNSDGTEHHIERSGNLPGGTPKTAYRTESQGIAALMKLTGWARTHIPELGPLTFGERRTFPLAPIETYTTEYAEASYRQN